MLTNSHRGRIPAGIHAVAHHAAMLGCAALLLSGAAPVLAADIGAGTMAAISDLMSSVSADRPPAGADADAWRKAVTALKTEGLAGAARPPHAGDTALLDAYGRALLLGPKSNQLRDQIGQLHDAVRGGQDAGIQDAIRAIYAKAGRPAPKDKAMEGLVVEAQRVGGSAPAETVNHSIERPGYTIAITDAIAAGQTSIEVTLKDGPGGKPARVVFEGEAMTRAKSGGEGLERRVEAVTACAMSTAAATALRDKLNGEWESADGEPVTISGSGASISVTDAESGRKRTYQGSYRLGKIDVRHAITHPDDIGKEMPAQVRQQLAKMGLSFTMRLETCTDPNRLTGRWGSQHVTYSTDFQVKKVHDPYDVRFNLIRAGLHEERSAEGAAAGESL